MGLAVPPPSVSEPISIPMWSRTCRQARFPEFLLNSLDEYDYARFAQG